MKLSKILFFTTIAAGALFTSCGNAQQEISVEKFGAVPNDGKNDFEALRAATAYCRENPGTTLFFPPGVYDIDNEKARKIEFEAVSGVYGENVQGVLFRPDGPYVTALDLKGCNNTTIKAHGATLYLNGWYEVVTMQGAKNITLEGISILYNRPPSTIGRVVETNAEWFDAEFDTERYRYIDNKVTGRLHFFDHVRNRLYTGWAKQKELIEPGKIRFHSTSNPPVGDYFVLRHGGHYRPAIMIKECENNTDATHFTSCSGTITIQNSKFKGQGDDCTNIHGYYYRMYPEGDNKIEIRIEGADLHALSLDYPEIGDTMVIIDNKSMAEQGRYIVQSVDTSSVDWKVVIGLDKPIEPEKFESCYMWNHTRFPKVRIYNNSVHSHLARSFLIKSRDVIIAKNCILNCTQTAIKLGAELGWRESAPAENVIVEENYITGCGYVAGANSPSCITLSTEARERPPFLNKNIIIRNNVFDTDKNVAVLLKDAENILVENNMANKKDYVKIENCQNIEIK